MGHFNRWFNIQCSLFGAVNQALMYHWTYSNYFHVIKESLRKKYPIRARLKNGNEITLRDGLVAYMLSLYGGTLYDYDNEILTLSFNDTKVKFQGVKVDSDVNWVCGEYLSAFTSQR